MRRFYRAGPPETHGEVGEYQPLTPDTATAMLTHIAPGPDPRGALLPGVTVAAEYRVTYKILPPGVGPDDYEPADLEDGERVLEMSDPDPAGFVGDHLISYGPPHHEVEKALTPHLPAGATPIILHVTKT